MMKKILLFGFQLLAAASLLSCAEPGGDESETLARINGYRLTVDAFDRHVASDLEMDEAYKVTQQAKRDMLNALIRQQILIQEAKRRNLDAKEDFVQTIQQYWESTLIRNLLALKGKEIDERIYVSEEEIAQRYKKMKAHQPGLPPLKILAKDLADELKEEKKTRLLESWMEDLEENAEVEINEELL